ncbi:Hsp33 family molecular chaperone HslO [Thermotomaculum hydrothermale]|nr:Hsp33 family molecular chaperone HslO [Thermotomaculum hydrothermale]
MDIINFYLSGDGKFRFVFAETKDVVNKIREIHKMTYPVANAVSRFVTGTVLISSNLKSGDVLGAYLDVNGPIGGIRCEANSYGHIKGYAINPDVGVDEFDSNYVMDLNQLLGSGMLTVTRVLKRGKVPFTSNIEFKGGSLALMFADYLKRSEQINSAVFISNFMKPDGFIENCGGFIVQPMPDATEKEIEKMEKEIEKLPPFSEVLKEVDNVNQAALLLFPNYKLKQIGERHLVFKCTCSRDKVLKVLKSLKEEDRKQLLLDDGTYLVVCEYCKKEYRVKKEEVENFK